MAFTFQPRTAAPAANPRNQMVRQVAQQLMQGQGTPAYGWGGAIANFAKPFLGHMMAGSLERSEKEAAERAKAERRAETSAMGRMLEKARKARESGGDIYSVIDKELSEYGDADWADRVRRGTMERELAGLLSGPGERKTAKDAAGRLRYLDTGELAFPGAEVPEPKMGRIVEVADPESPTGTRYVEAREAVGQAGPPKSEWRMESVTDPATGQTTMTMVRGRARKGGGGEGVSKPTQSKLEQSIVRGTERLDRLRQITANMDTSFLELPEQIKQYGAAAAERLGIDIGPETRQQLKRYTRAKTATVSNLNRTLNELSGAAISPAEAKRLQAELPTMGDSPSEFQAKVDATTEAIQAAIARNQQLLESGVQNLQFGPNGEIRGGPSLEEFMLMQEAQAATPEAAPSAPVAAGMAPPTPDAGRFADITPEQLQTLDIDSLTDDEVRQVMRRMDALGMQ